MNVNVVANVVVVVIVVGCRPGDPAAPEPLPTTAPAADDRAALPVPPPSAPSVEIRSDGIGPIRLGAPIPAELAVADRYTLRLYADAQPLEGFWIGEPAIFAALADGPYRRWLADSGELDVPPPNRFAADAVREASAGALVEMAYVEAPGITTPEGVGVGTRHDDFIGAYPDAEVGPIPPLFEDPTCMGQTGALPRVHFFFDRCEDGASPPPDARVVRIAVR